MSAQNPAITEHELQVVEAMAAELDNYLKSEILFWQLSPQPAISPPPPMLTVGGLLLRLGRLEAQDDLLTAAQRIRLKQVRTAYDDTVQKWAAHTDLRIVRELEARLNSWEWFVDDCDAQKRSCIAYYATEAELRTLIALLLEAASAMAEVSAATNRLRGLDSRFRRWFQPGAFIWRSNWLPAYPEERFWWLYGRPEFPSE